MNSSANTSIGRRLARMWAGFSLVEVVIAIGIVSFSILVLIALLPVGLKMAKESVEQAQSINLISALSADLKNSPTTSTTSAIFKIGPLPWKKNAAGQSVPAVTTSETYYYWGTDNSTILAASSSTPPSGGIYRITIRYTRVPTYELSAIEALVVVSWPANLDPFAQGTASRPTGRLDSYLTLPKP